MHMHVDVMGRQIVHVIMYEYVLHSRIMYVRYIYLHTY